MTDLPAQFPNLVALSAQSGCVVVAAALISYVLRVGRPTIHYGFWRLVLAVCLVLPWLQTPRPPTSPLDPVVTVSTAATAGDASNVALERASIDWEFWVVTIVVCGAALRLAWMVVGYIRLRRLRVAGECVDAIEITELQTALRTRAEIRQVDGVRQPVTFGVLRPIVLLPSTLRRRSAEIRQAILAHELVHVQRRDWCWVVIEELVRTVFWFNPAMWWLISQVQHAREEVIDATVVMLTGRRREYLEALLAFSDDVPLAPASAFARRRHLFRRIVLLSTEEVMSARRIVVSAFVMGVVLVAATVVAARAFPLRDTVSSESSQPSTTITSLEQPPGALEQSAKPATPDNPIPKRIYGEQPVFPATAEGEDTSVTVTLRSVVDEVGNVVALRLASFSFRRGGISASAQGMSFSQFTNSAQFKDGPDGAVITAQSLRPMLVAFIESAADTVQRWRYDPPKDGPLAFNVVVHFANGKATTSDMLAAARTTVSADGAIRVGGNVRVPTKVKDVKPVYPPEAKDARVQGVVIAEVRIEPDGRVGNAQILRSIPMLDAAALEAIRQWEFTPTLLNGAPVPVLLTVTVQFSLGQ
jgi:TonB family protein